MAVRGSRRGLTGLYRGGGVMMMLSGIGLLVPQVYENTLANAQIRDQATVTTQRVERSWQAEQPTATSSHVQSAPSYPNGFVRGQIFAVLHIPAIGVIAPIAEGVDKGSVLDRGWIGHYSGAEETAFPWQGIGNFALAAHRNTHGEPFRHLDQVESGDEVVVETAQEFFVYRITGGLSQVSPGDVGVLRPVPAGSGFGSPGRYITLTTCTPDFTSWFRLVRFGVLTRVVPREFQSTGIPGL